MLDTNICKSSLSSFYEYYQIYISLLLLFYINCQVYAGNEALTYLVSYIPSFYRVLFSYWARGGGGGTGQGGEGAGAQGSNHQLVVLT